MAIIDRWFIRFLEWAFPRYLNEITARRWDYYHNFSERLELNPTDEYITAITFWSPDKRVRKANLLRVLADAVVRLPAGTIVSLRERSPTDFGRSKGVACYTIPGLFDKESAYVIDVDAKREYNEAEGYIDHGFYRI